jgi:hypothetical protein
MYFDSELENRKAVNLRGANKRGTSNKQTFVEKLQEEREERQLQRKKIRGIVRWFISDLKNSEKLRN